MIKKDFFDDLELYLCERFGYRNSIHVTPTMNGCCVSVLERDVKLYFRLWEYSKNVGGFPDWCIILVDCTFAKKQEQNLFDLARFFKEFGTLYGFKHLGTEQDKGNLHQQLGLQRTNYSSIAQNYVASLESLSV